MPNRLLPLLAAAALVLPAAAQFPPPVDNAASAQAKGRFVFRGYAAPVPAAWEPQAPGSSFRAGQYRVPAAPGAAPGEVVVYYFGAGQGGSAQANVERWTAQFTTDDGRPVRPKVETLRVDGMPVTLVELNGRYARGVGMGAGTPARAGQTLVAAVVETAEGNLTFQLHGDQATVRRHRKGFDAMVKGLRAR